MPLNWTVDSLTVGLLTNACTSSETSATAETISEKQECRWCLSPPKMLKKHTFNYSLRLTSGLWSYEDHGLYMVHIHMFELLSLLTAQPGV